MIIVVHRKHRHQDRRDHAIRSWCGRAMSSADVAALVARRDKAPTVDCEECDVEEAAWRLARSKL